jgi:hypothetical protein
MHDVPAVAAASGSCCNMHNTPDLLLEHPNKTIATYIRKQLNHSKHAPETHVKTLEKQLQTYATSR